METNGWIKLLRSPAVYELLRHRNAFILLTIIAIRARRTPGSELKIGQAFIGDYANYGMSRGEYRSAKKSLAAKGITTFRTTNRGTIATLIDSGIYDINPEGQQPDKQPSDNLRDSTPIATNKNEKNYKNENKLNTYSGKNQNGHGRTSRTETEYRQSEQYPDCIRI